MTNHSARKIRPHATPKLPRPAKQPKQEPSRDYYLAQKAKALAYDYAGIPEQHREALQRAALDIRSRLKRTVEDVIAIGEQLVAVKGLLAHGKFGEWLDQEFKMSDRSARNYMAVAEKFGGKTETVSVLDAKTLYLLAAKSTPDTVRWEVLERMELLDYRPTHAQVRRIIADHEPAPVAEPEPDAIEAEYTVVHETDELLHLTLPRGTVHKLMIAVVGGKPLKFIMEGGELDHFFITIQRALEERI